MAIFLEQAVYTSAVTRQGRGYHLTARSPGVDDELAAELSQWCPSDRSLIGQDPDADSINVFPISNARMVVSRSF